MPHRSRSKKGISTLEAVIAGTILSMGTVAALSLYSSSARKSRATASAVAMIPMKDAILADALTAIWTPFQTAAKSVPPPTSTCIPNACIATFGNTLPVDFVNFPQSWLNAPGPGPHLMSPPAGVSTRAVSVVPSSVLENLPKDAQANVDPAYCRATTFKGPGKVDRSFVFQLQTKALTPGSPNYSAYYSFFESLYRPYTPTPGNPPPFSPPGGDSNTTYRFAMKGTTVVPQLFQGGDSWLTSEGDPVLLPSHLGFYYSKSGACTENPQPPSVCNTSATPVTFNFDSGDIRAMRLTAANAPAYTENTIAAKAIRRCANQTLNNPNFGVSDSIYFCLVFNRPENGAMVPSLGNGMNNVFGEFMFRVRDVKTNGPLSCAAVGAKLKKSETDYYGELSYTLFWTDTNDPRNPKPKHASGTVTRMDVPQ